MINVFLPKENPDSQPAAKKLPRTILSFYPELSQSMLQQKSWRVCEKELKVTDAEAKYLVQCTHLRAQSTAWFEHRNGCLTTSHFGAICRISVDKPVQSLVTQLLKWNLIPKCAALTWSIENKSKARLEYEEVMRQHIHHLSGEHWSTYQFRVPTSRCLTRWAHKLYLLWRWDTGD